MILGIFRRSRNEAVIERLHAAVVEASRHRALFSLLGLPDTLEGRFESLTLHAFLVIRRLREDAVPGPDMAQSLVDTVFRHLDRTLREMGVGDTSVPKRMKVLAEAFMGRSAAYEEALGSGSEALAVCLRRNVYQSKSDATDLARYVEACVRHLSTEPLQTFMNGAFRLPDPAAFVTDALVASARAS